MMAALFFTLLLVLVTFVVLPTARASGVKQDLYQRNASMDGLKPNTTALFQTPALSPKHCGLQCTGLDGCRSYTYIADEPSSCRGYDVAMTPQTMTPAAGATTFEVVLADCPLADLAEGFLQYEKSILSTSFLWSRTGISLSECRERCLHNVTNCRSFAYQAGMPRCYLCSKTALTHASGYNRESTGTDYYQRTCN